MAVQFANHASTSLASDIAVGATSFTVTDASMFPTLGTTDHMHVSIGASEVTKVTSVAGNVCTCAAITVAHAAGENAQIRINAELLADIRDAGADKDYVDSLLEEHTLLGL